MDLNQVTLPSNDVEKSVAFYQDMGFNLIVLALPNYARFESLEGNSTFSIHKVESSDNSGAIIYFETKEMDAIVRELAEKGFQFDKFPTNEDWGWREASLRDPDENQIIIYFAGEYRKNPPWKVRSKD